MDFPVEALLKIFHYLNDDLLIGDPDAAQFSVLMRHDVLFNEFTFLSGFVLRLHEYLLNVSG